MLEFTAFVGLVVAVLSLSQTLGVISQLVGELSWRRKDRKTL